MDQFQDGTDHLSYRPPEDISEEELKVLRTQDIGYLFTALQKEKKVGHLVNLLDNQDEYL